MRGLVRVDAVNLDLGAGKARPYDGVFCLACGHNEFYVWVDRGVVFLVCSTCIEEYPIESLKQVRTLERLAKPPRRE